MIIGIGVDVVDMPRFAGSLVRTPGLAARLFSERELNQPGGKGENTVSQAARFAAKEAVAKALGAPAGLRWHDCEVLVGERGKPYLEISGTVLETAKEQNITRWHLSLSHDGAIATAFVIAENV
ncbi:MAG: holo-ACP synthase [Candidatus Nanopelagicales bacterium]